MSNKIAVIFASILIAFGLFYGYEPLMRELRNSSATAESLEAPEEIYNMETEEPAISGNPVRIEVPSVGIDLEVIDGYYNAGNNSWTLSKEKAQFAKVSSPANNKEGNTFIYGHNAPGVFNKLPGIKIGDKATVTTDNGRKFIYEYYDLSVTRPDDVSIFEYKGPPILTMQTCSGAWYQNRSLFAFSLKEVI